MTNRIVERSPQVYARIGGILYLIIIIGGIFTELGVLQELVVSRDPAATAANILAHETLYRSGIAAHAVILACSVTLFIILYHLFNRVNTTVALMLVAFNLVSLAIEGVSLVYLYEPLILLKGGSSMHALSTDQLQALAYIPLALQSVGYDLALIFFGIVCIAIGYLIVTSTFLPRILGGLMVLAGVCYLINSFVHFLAPHLSGYLLSYILLPCFIGELALCLWLMVKGVHEQKWHAMANA